MSAEIYQSGLFHDRCRLLSFQFNPWTKFAWCRLGNVRSAPSDDASFLDPDHSSFLADVDCHFFFYQYRWIIYFCRVGLMFSWPNKWEHASFGRNKMSVELAQKNLTDLHCTSFMQHQNTKTSTAVKKSLSVSERFQIKIVKCRLKIISCGYFTTDVSYWVFNSFPEWNMHEVR